MHVEISRLLTGWLKHPEFGVNALLPQVGRSKLVLSGPAKTDSQPAKVTIYNDVDDEVIDGVIGINPPLVPSLVVVSDIDMRNTDVRQEKKSGREISGVTGIGYYAEEGESRAANIRDGNYVLRAVMKSLNAWNESPQRSSDYRELNGVRVARLNGITIQRVAGGIQGKLVGFVMADLFVMDMAP